MKEKIKEWWRNNCTVGKIEVTLGIIFAVRDALLGWYSTALVWLAFAILALYSIFLERRNGKLYSAAKEANRIAKECNENEKKAIETTQWAFDELQLEQQRHRLTAIQGMKHKNKADFMQHKKSLSEYLKLSAAIDNIYEQEVKRLHEMLDEIKNKNDGEQKD